ncbi:MAG: hypothetical protein ACOZQL_21195 [Myxococcota bacterium]
MSHFSCIGLDGASPEAFQQAVERCLSSASPERGRLVWRDPSGAALVAHLDGDAIACVTPWFQAGAPSVWQVTTRAPQLDECVHCSGVACDLLVDGALASRAFVQLLRFTDLRAWLSTERTWTLEVVAFAHAFEAFDGAEQFEAWQADFWRGPDGAPRTQQDGRPMRFAETFFLPEGMFEQPMQAMALFSGRAVSAQWHTNTLTGTRFGLVRLATLVGELNVVLADEGQRLPKPEQRCVVRAWLVGERRA